MTNAVNIAASGSLGGLVNTTWTTATRPASPVAGQQGFNTTLGAPEWYSSATSSWISGQLPVTTWLL